MPINIRTPEEALFIACEMEKRAVRMYERMLMLFANPDNKSTLDQLLKDEQGHLKHFQQMLGENTLSGEEALLLSAHGSGILFAGGLTEALRHGGVDTPEKMLAYAASQEEIAIHTYQGFAKRTQGEAAETFLAIAREEQQHLRHLNTMLEKNEHHE